MSRPLTPTEAEVLAYVAQWSVSSGGLRTSEVGDRVFCPRHGNRGHCSNPWTRHAGRTLANLERAGLVVRLRLSDEGATRWKITDAGDELNKQCQRNAACLALSTTGGKKSRPSVTRAPAKKLRRVRRLI